MPTYYNNVEFSEQAAEDYNNIIQYLLNHWTKAEVRKFILAIDKDINRIQHFPLAFPASPSHKDIRRCVVSPIHTIYYKIKEEIIYIITIFDNRREARP